MRLSASSSSGRVPGDLAIEALKALTLSVSWVRIGRSSIVSGGTALALFFAARLTGLAREAAVFFLAVFFVDRLRDFDTESSSEKVDGV